MNFNVLSLDTNVALNKPVQASSVHDKSTIPQNAVDGNLHSSHGTCALTQRTSSRSWLKVDLKAEYNVFYVQIKGRENEGAMQRSQPFDVLIGNSNENGGASNQYCFQQCKHDAVNSLKRFDCPPGTKGRYASFFTRVNTHLDLCELEVYGFQ